jgi:hypothetical protein
MQETAAHVASAVDQLRADADAQQRIRTELARTGAERLVRGEAELATREASRAADQPQLDKAAIPLLDHSDAVSEGADPRFVPSIAAEVDRRDIAFASPSNGDALDALAALLERLAKGAIRDEIEVYLQLGAEATKAAKTAWTEAKAKD